MSDLETLLHRTVSGDDSRAVLLCRSPLLTHLFATISSDFGLKTRPAFGRTIIRDPGLIAWHPFSEIYVGVASYDDQPDSMSPDEFNAWLPRRQEWIARVESERTWWAYGTRTPEIP